MAQNEILGIVGQLDISDIYGSLYKMSDAVEKLTGVSQQMSKRLRDAFTDLGNATEKELGEKSKNALSVLSQALSEAKSSADKNLSSIEGVISNLQKNIKNTSKEMMDIPLSSDKYKQLEKDLENWNSQLVVAEKNLAITKAESLELAQAIERVSGAASLDGLKLSAEKLVEKLNEVNTSAQTLAKIKAIKESNMPADVAELTSLLEQYKKECVITANTAGEAYEEQGRYVEALRAKVEELKKKMAKGSPNDPGRETLQDEYNKLSIQLNLADAAHIELKKTQKEATNQAIEAQSALNSLNKTVSESGNIASDTSRKIKKESKEASDSVKKETSGIEESLNKLKTIAAGYLSFTFAKQFGDKVMQVRGQFQQLEVAFKTMLGSEQKAMELMEQLTKTAAITPFDLQGVTQGAKQLLAYGVAADEINDTLIHLGDIAAGLSLPLNDLVFLYGTTITQGRMFTQDLRQFMGRGIPIAEELAKQFGVTKDKVGELVTAGKVGAEEFKRAIMSMSSEGGKFAGLMEAQSKTITGQISNIEDAVDSMLNNIGKQSEGVINSGLNVVSGLVENYERVGRVVGSLIATYGAYKTVIIALNTVKAIEELASKRIVAAKIAETGATLTAAGTKAAEDAITKTLTATELVHYGRIMLVEKAQKLLNATMLNNPYVIVAVALGTLVTAMMAAETEQERINDAIEEYNREKEEVIRNEEEHKKKIEELINVAEDESQSTKDREKALRTLLASYPSIFQKYEKEARLLSKIKDIKKEIAELDGRTSLRKSTNEKKYIEDRIKDIEKEIDARSRGDKGLYNAEFSKITGQQLRDKLKALKKESARLDKEIVKEERSKYLSDMSNLTEGQIRAQINERNKLITELLTNKDKKVGKVKYGGVTGEFDIDELKAQRSAFRQELERRKKISEDSNKDFDKEHKDALKKAENNLKDWEKLSKAEERRKSKDKSIREMDDEAYKKELANRQQIVSDAKKIVDADEKAKKGGVTDKGNKNNPEIKNAEDLAKLKRKQRQDEAQQELEAIRAEEEAKIAEMADGAEKERRQVELDHQRKLDQIEREKQQMIEKNIEYVAQEYNKNKKKNEKGFYTRLEGNNLTAEEQKAIALKDNQSREIEAKTKKANTEFARQTEELSYKQLQTLYDYLEKYGTIQAQKAAITKKYDYQIAKEQDIILKESLRKQKEDALKALDLQELSNSIDWETIFNNLDRATTEALKNLRDKLRAQLDNGTVSPENAAVLSERLLVIENKIAEKSNFWASLIPPLQERVRLTNQVLDAERKITSLKNDQADKERELYKLLTDVSGMSEGSVRQKFTAEIQGGDITSIADVLGIKEGSDEWQKLQVAMENYRSSLIKTTAAQENLQTLQSMFKKGGTGIFSGIGEILTNSAESAGGGIAGWMSVINTNAKSMSEFVDKIGIGETEFGKSVHDFADGVGGFSNAIQALMSGDIFGAVNGVIDGVVGLGNALGRPFGLGGADYSGYDKAKEKYNQLSKIWDELINKKRQYLSESWGIEAQKAGDEALKLLAIEKEQNRILAEQRLGSGSSTGSHSIWYRMWKGSYSSEGKDNLGRLNNGRMASTAGDINWQDVNKAVERGLQNAGLGKVTFNDMYDMLNMTGEQLEWIKENYAGLWANMDDEFKNALENIIKFGETEKEIIESVREQILGTSFDTVFNSFMSSMYNMADGAKDVEKQMADDWQQMMNKMILNNIMGEKYKEKLKKWYEKWYAAYNDDNKLTQNEINDLRNEYNALIKEGADEVKALREQGVVKQINGNDQQSTYNSLEKWSYEQADDLINRATALQIIDENQYQILLQSLEVAYSTLSGVEGIRTTVQEIATAIAMTIELQEAANGKLDKIIANTNPIGEIRDLVKKLYNER